MSRAKPQIKLTKTEAFAAGEDAFKANPSQYASGSNPFHPVHDCENYRAWQDGYGNAQVNATK